VLLFIYLSSCEGKWVLGKRLIPAFCPAPVGTKPGRVIRLLKQPLAGKAKNCWKTTIMREGRQAASQQSKGQAPAACGPHPSGQQSLRLEPGRRGKS
jgi:hypothetical protein